MVRISFKCGPDFLFELAQGCGLHQCYLFLDEVRDRSVDVVHVNVSEVSDSGVLFVYFLHYAACAVSKGSDHVLGYRNRILAAAIAHIDFIALSMESKHHHHFTGSYLAEAFHLELHDIEARSFVKYICFCEHISQLFRVSRVREELSESLESQLYGDLPLGYNSSLSFYLRKQHWLVTYMLPILNCLESLHILDELGGNCLEFSIAGLFLHILLI